jgi:hypothetical protein
MKPDHPRALFVGRVLLIVAILCLFDATLQPPGSALGGYLFAAFGLCLFGSLPLAYVACSDTPDRVDPVGSSPRRQLFNRGMGIGLMAGAIGIAVSHALHWGGSGPVCLRSCR